MAHDVYHVGKQKTIDEVIYELRLNYGMPVEWGWQPLFEVIRKESGIFYVKCICSCGKEAEIEVHGGKLHSKSCTSCAAKKSRASQKPKHGHSTRTRTSPTYITWINMKNRCLNNKITSYKWYGARGITVCKEWYIFKNFLADMGKKPEGKSLGRIDNNGNYNKNNCRWSTPEEQARNTSRNYYFEVDGEMLCLSDAAEKFNLSTTTITHRIRDFGWTIEEALFTLPNARRVKEQKPQVEMKEPFWIKTGETRRDKRSVLHERCICVCGKESWVYRHKDEILDTQCCLNCKLRWKGYLGHLSSNKQHGHVKLNSYTYKTWRSMKSRCYNKGVSNYKYYGGRGIVVCDRWKNSFLNFLEDMGERPYPEATLDRIDPNKNYEKSNCQWKSQAENNNRKATVRYVEHNGVSRNIMQWCKELKLSRSWVHNRIKRGFTPAQALGFES